MKDLVVELKFRGRLDNITSPDIFREHLNESPRTVYCGFDPTADSLHLGNLLPLLVLRRFQQKGHKPILLIGGGTGMIGDPSGRSEERNLQTPEAVRERAEKIKTQAARFLDFDGDSGATVVNNADWLEQLNLLDFLRNVGKHFNVNTMLHKESIKNRLGEESTGFSATEFTYLMLQAYDFAKLYESHGCTIQLGGSDQWGNITAGIDLIRQMHGARAFGITCPLVCKSNGEKFGKTAKGAIWLDENLTSPYALFQFCLNTSDDDLPYLMLKFTNASPADYQSENPSERVPHRVFAEKVTRLVHGEEGLRSARRITECLFSNNTDELLETDFEQLSLGGLPTKKVTRDSISLVEALVELEMATTNLGVVSAKQARRLIESNSIAVNGVKTKSTNMDLLKSDATFGRFFLLQKGKKSHGLLELTS